MQNDANKGSLTDKFRDFGAAPSDGLWDSIAGQLDERKKRRGAFWWWAGGGLAACFLLIGIYFFGVSRPGTQTRAQTPQPLSATHPENTESNAFSFPTSEVAKEERSSAPTLENTPQQPRDRQPSRSPENGDVPTNSNSELVAPVIAETLHTTNAGDTTPSDTASPRDLAVVGPAHSDSTPGGTFVFPGAAHSFRLTAPKQWMFAVHVSRRQDNGHEPQSSPPPTFDMASSGFLENTVPSVAKNPLIHRHWSLEVEASRRIGRRTWLGSGVQVGYFSSDRTSVSAAYTNALVTAWTIGIPLHLNVDVIARDRLQVYTGAGLNIDFALRRKLQYEPGSTAQALMVEEVTSPGGYLGSTQLHAGVRYRVWNNLSLDVRPGVRHYFEPGLKNGVNLSNNWWWGITAGVAWQF